MYFASDRFISKTDGISTYDFENLENNIERDYLENLNISCNQILRYKHELEYKIQYYRNSYYRGVLERVCVYFNFRN